MILEITTIDEMPQELTEEFTWIKFSKNLDYDTIKNEAEKRYLDIDYIYPVWIGTDAYDKLKTTNAILIKKQ